ncbi:hypothetical protein Barb4_00630 [Bacteroidales bacterium Barb4]|nr:hypothetical protein Barb4_00630 [Bacteroidales bacterium Barb4]
MSSLQDFLCGIVLNPTFRFAACGAEIFCPFGTFVCINYFDKPSIQTEILLSLISIKPPSTFKASSLFPVR